MKKRALKQDIVRNNILVFSVFQQKAPRNGSEAGEAQLFIQAESRCIALHDGIELEYAKIQFPGLLHTVSHQRFADMQSARFAVDGVAGITDMPASSYIVRMQNIQPQHVSGISVKGKAGKGLAAEKSVAGVFRQTLFLRKGCSFLNNLIPYAYGVGNMFP